MRACAGAYPDTARTIVPRFALSGNDDDESPCGHGECAYEKCHCYLDWTVDEKEGTYQEEDVRNVPTVRVSMENATAR